MNNYDLPKESKAVIDVDAAALLGIIFGVLLHILILFSALMMPAAAQAEVGDFRSWGVGGRAQFSVGTGADVMPSDVIALRGGALLVATSCNEQPSRDWCFTKLNFNGSVDTTWGTNNSGSVMEITPAQDFVRGMLPLDDGGWYAFGSCGSQSCIGRYHANGARNTALGGSGRITAAGLSMIDIEVLGDGRIVYAGECFGGGIYRACVGRLLANGSADPSFNNGQALVFTMGEITGNSSYQANSIKFDAAQNRYWVGGRCQSNGKFDFCLARVTDAGQLDTSFTPNGWFRFSVASIEDISQRLLLRPDGYPLLVGYCRTSVVDPFLASYCVAEVLPWTGVLNSAFGNNGTRLVNVQADAQHSLHNRSAFLQADGSLGIVGSCIARSSTHRACFALLAANGSDDLRLRSSRAVQYLGSSDTTPTRLVGSSRVVRGVGDTRTLYAFGSCGATGSGTPCLGLIEWAAPRGGECTLDVDGDGQVLATTDGVLLTRIAAGMRGNAATANAVGPGTRQAWEAIRGMLARDCGMMIAP